MAGSVSPRRNRRHRGEEPSANLVNTVMASNLVNPCRHREEHQRTEITSPPSEQHGRARSGEMHDPRQRRAAEQRPCQWLKKWTNQPPPRSESHRRGIGFLDRSVVGEWSLVGNSGRREEMEEWKNRAARTPHPRLVRTALHPHADRATAHRHRSRREERGGGGGGHGVRGRVTRVWGTGRQVDEKNWK
jgi:hypothetical protein